MSAVESSGAETRVMISKMVFENFKSYAGVQEIGPFHKNFSAVVGPNGSGKSNVIDGLLFVCGHRAKKLRQSKVRELIHSSPEHPDLDFAKVSIHWVRIVDQPDGEFEIVPGSETIISRAAYKNNDSKYFVNGKTKKFAEVASKLREYGIDLDHNRFLILQGEVEQIATMKPKGITEHDEGLLEYLEDIIGSNKYVDAIDKAGVEVETLNAARAEHINRVKLVEREKDRLKGAKSEAEEYLEQESQIFQKKSVLYQLFAHEAKKAALGAAEKKESVQQQLQQERDSLSGVQKDLEDFETTYASKKKEHDVIAAEMEKAKADFAVFERKDVQFREDLKHLKVKSKKATDAIKRHEKKKADSEYAIKTGEEDIKKTEKATKEFESMLKKEEAALEQVYESLKGVTDPLREELEGVQEAMIPHKQQMEGAQSKVDVAEAERTLLVKEIQAADQAVTETKEQLESVVNQLAEAEVAVGTLSDEKAQVSKTIKKAEKQLGVLRPEAEQLTEQIRQLRPEVEEAKRGKNDDESRSTLLRSLLKAKDSKRLNGIHSRLGDLGTIDAKYDVAISTACGSLNNVVVDTTRDGQRAVQMLRENNLGRCTFIILDELKYLREKAATPVETPEGVPRLYDLVDVSDPKYKVAFFYALQNTLVAEDLEQATRIAYGKRRWRVVTLDGKLIDRSGTMAGGGNKVARGGMSSHASSGASSEKDIARMEKQLTQACERLSSVRVEIQQLEHTLSEAKARFTELETQCTKVDMDLKSLAEQKITLESNLVELKKQPKKDVNAEKKRVAALDKEIAKYSKEVAKAGEMVANYEAQVEALQKKLMDAGGVRLRAQKAKVDDLVKQIDESSSALTKIQVQISSARKAIEKADKAIEASQAEVEDIEEQIVNTKAEFKKIDDEAVAVMESYKQTQDMLSEKGDELDEISKQYETMKKAVSKMRTVEVDLSNALDDINHKIREAESKGKHWQLKLDTIRADAAKLFQIEGLDDTDVSMNDSSHQEGKDSDNEDELDEEDTVAVLKSKMKMPTLDEEELSEISKDEISFEINILEENLKKLEPNMSAIVEYRQRHTEYLTRVRELDAATEERDAKRKEYEDLRKQRLDDFMAGFSQISMKLKEMYQMITLGGDAELELVDSLDPFSEGVLFSVRPPKKSWKNIINLSGGEKTLSSLALVFALHHYKPTPLYVMDEIDAALDFKNVSIVANYIKERTRNAQFIIISLRNNMFELADRLVGIYKTYNQTKSITINPHKFAVPHPKAVQRTTAPKAAAAAVV